MDIEALAKKAGMVTEWHAGAASCVWTNGIAGVSAEELKAFAALVAKEEREECKADCRRIGAQYPTDIWPENGESLDCKSARMSRLTAENCEREIDNRSNATVQATARQGRSPGTPG